jgi:two-component system CheB/CheR fusion protein
MSISSSSDAPGKLDRSADNGTTGASTTDEAHSLPHVLPAEHERLLLALGAAGIGVWEYDAADGYMIVDANARVLLGIGDGTAGALPEIVLLEAIAREDRGRVLTALRGAADGRRYDESFRVGTAGETRWIRSIGRLQGMGDDARLIGVSFDITPEREALAAHDLLLAEMNHRIKNLFTVIGGMVAVCAREANDVRAFATDLGDRIAAMGRAHGLTQQSSMQRELDLRELVEAVISPTRSHQAIAIRGDPLTVPLKLVTPLALIFHEWATNAAKYGALAHPDGSLAVRWDKDEAGHTTIEWCETCPQPGSADNGQAGFGTRLIEATLAQLRARLTGSQGDGILIRRIELGGL